MFFLLLALVAFMYMVELRSLDNSLQGLSCQHDLSQVLAAPQEVIATITSLTNHSRRFLPYIRLVEYLPGETVVHADSLQLTKDLQGGWQHSATVYLMPRSKLERRLQISLPRRGHYLFRGLQLGGGDFLGLSEVRQQVESFNEVIIYPPESTREYLPDTLGGFVGDISLRRFILEDPVLTVGFREYSGREPLKSISWQQSARLDKLMVKQYDYTTEPSLTVVLSVAHQGEKEEAAPLLEECYALCHTVCRLLEEKGIKYDFVSNMVTAGAWGSWSYIPEGLGAHHFTTILEGLGRATYQCGESFTTMLRRVLANPGERGLVIITPDPTISQERLLSERHPSSYLILSAEDPDKPSSPGA
ncbi:MAG: DUF58 domain-containing protein [Symbiobacteriaceae bacterium]|nr:DUF58 domain-containing protein [Symbiobacteriaceae bacterium]